MSAEHKRKEPRVASALVFVAGPLGFLYVGWAYAVAATVVFLSFWVLASLLPVPAWLIYVNLPLFSFIAYRICETINSLYEQGQHRNALASNTLPVAAFAMTSSLPLLAAVNSGVMGVNTAVSLYLGGNVGDALFMALAVTPIFTVVNFIFFVVIAAGIDRYVLMKAPMAPRHIFPPAITVGE
jgi:hypothetical protein